MKKQYNIPVPESNLHATVLEVLENTTDKKLLLDIIQSATDSYLQQGGSVHVLNIRLKRLKTPIETFALPQEVVHSTEETEVAAS